MKIKTAEATDLVLDWLVAKAEGITKIDSLGMAWVPDPGAEHFNIEFKPSTNWSQGGPIIEREGITVRAIGKSIEGFLWDAIGFDQDEESGVEGPTALIAAMRCFVASKLGDEVDIPEELLT